MRATDLLFLGLGLAVLGGSFLAFRPAPAPVPSSPQAAAVAAAPAASEPAAAEVHRIVVAQGQRVSGPGLIRVPQGSTLQLELTSDVADELHLHGYDLSLNLEPGVPATLSFTADRAGRFELELHATHLQLGVLEVLPPGS